MTTATAVIRTRGLTKDYGHGHGVFALDLEVERGEVLVFLGPNGAGKSTTMRLLLDLIRPTAGSATLLGLDSRGILGLTLACPIARLRFASGATADERHRFGDEPSTFETM